MLVGLPLPCWLRKRLTHCARATLGRPCSFGPVRASGRDQMERILAGSEIENVLVIHHSHPSPLPSRERGQSEIQLEKNKGESIWNEIERNRKKGQFRLAGCPNCELSGES